MQPFLKGITKKGVHCVECIIYAKRVICRLSHITSEHGGNAYRILYKNVSTLLPMPSYNASGIWVSLCRIPIHDRINFVYHIRSSEPVETQRHALL